MLTTLGYAIIWPSYTPLNENYLWRNQIWLTNQKVRTHTDKIKDNWFLKINCSKQLPYDNEIENVYLHKVAVNKEKSKKGRWGVLHESTTKDFELLGCPGS